MPRKLNPPVIIVASIVAMIAAISISVSVEQKPATQVKGLVITTSTTAPTTTSSTLPPPPDGLGVGTTGPVVTELQQRLLNLHYDIAVNGTYDNPTYHAVMAFQKVSGLKRTGRATTDVFAALGPAVDPAPLIPNGESNRIEVDIPRQVLFLYTGGKLNRILPVATGGGYKYCVEGSCAYAVTPGGKFHVYKKIKGIRVSKLGQLWNPIYFNRGIAIHGAPNVPPYPASHGCVRIPMYSSPWMYNVISNGTTVYVVGGPTNYPAPFRDNSELAPGQAPPTDVTTTTVPGSTTTDLSTTSTTQATTTTS